MMGQLTLDGGEDDVPVGGSRSAPLNAVQRGILAVVREQGSIRSVEAGVIVHAARNGGAGCTRPAGARSHAGGGLGCCAYAAEDGRAACVRLMQRGLLQRRQEDGRRSVWEPAA